MKIGAIIAEYNPYHNGHQYQLDWTRKNGATHVVAVMSGSFVQRAEPALLSKFRRAKIAVECGVDLVLELPVQYATASSERFAEGAISILDSLGCVDVLSFGSECGDIAQLEHAAAAVTDERVIQVTKQLYETGDPYPKARQKAVEGIYGGAAAGVLKKPNNLLGVDYLKALRARSSGMDVVTVPRQGAGHDSGLVLGNYASASNLRAKFLAGENMASFLPSTVLRELRDAGQAGEFCDGFSAVERLVLYKVRAKTREGWAAIPDCADGLGDRLYRAAATATTPRELCSQAKTRRYTMSRVRRAVLCAVLGITANLFFAPPYARILAIGKGGQEILHRAKQGAQIPVSHDIKTLLTQGHEAAVTASLEIAATDLYSLAMASAGPAALDYTSKLYKVER